MTKKELNAIRTAAYTEWTKTAEAQELLATSYTVFRCWQITEGAKISLMTTTHDTQVNKVTLEARGFSRDASVKLLFTANRQTKTLTPTDWN